MNQYKNRYAKAVTTTGVCLGTLAISYVTINFNLASANDSNVPNSGRVSAEASRIEIDRLTKAWLETGWRHMDGDQPFSFHDRLDKYYDLNSTDVFLFDDFDQQKRIARSPREYGQIWDVALKNFKMFYSRVEPDSNILVSGNLAVATVKYAITFDAGDGVIHHNRTLDTVVWRRGPHGWKIIREYGSGLTTSAPSQPS